MFEWQRKCFLSSPVIQPWREIFSLWLTVALFFTLTKIWFHYTLYIAKLIFIFNFNFKLVKRWYGYILNIPSHPPTHRRSTELPLEWSIQLQLQNNFNLSLFCIDFGFVHSPTRQASSDKFQFLLQIQFQIQVSLLA